MADSKNDTDAPSADEKERTNPTKTTDDGSKPDAAHTEGATDARAAAGETTTSPQEPGRAKPDVSEARKPPAKQTTGTESGAATRRTGTKKKSPSPREQKPEPAPAAERRPVNRSFGIAAGALLIGLAGGWVGHENRARLMPQKEAAAAEEGADACKAWEKQVCDASGEQTPACQQAKAAAGLLTPELCTEAQGQLPGILAAVKAGRADCDKLVIKLCADLGKETPTCKMVEERTQMFPADRCGEMLEGYDQVIGELKMIQAQGGPGPQPGTPPGAHPGMPPGAGQSVPPGAHPGMPPGAGQSVPPGAHP